MDGAAEVGVVISRDIFVLTCVPTRPHSGLVDVMSQRLPDNTVHRNVKLIFHSRILSICVRHLITFNKKSGWETFLQLEGCFYIDDNPK